MLGDMKNAQNKGGKKIRKMRYENGINHNAKTCTLVRANTCTFTLFYWIIQLFECIQT